MIVAAVVVGVLLVIIVVLGVLIARAPYGYEDTSYHDGFPEDNRTDRRET